MSNTPQNNDDIEVINSEQVPVYDKPTLPADATVIMLTEEQNYDYGGTLSTAYQLPLDRLTASGTRQAVSYSLTATGDDGADINIPDGTVVPAYVEAFDPFRTMRAQASSSTTKARFLIVALNQNVDDNYIIQSSGFHTFAEPHNYQVGQTYYLSDSSAGGVTNVPPVSIVQPLFYVVDNKTILISIGA